MNTAVKRIILIYLTVSMLLLSACANKDSQQPKNDPPATNSPVLSVESTPFPTISVSVEDHSNDVKIHFTNKYGTSTTLCAHEGCTNYIANSGDTNCCVEHSNRCLECKCYIDEDATFCISCLEKAAEQAKNNTKHYCEVCGKEASYSIDGFSGSKEYYCSKHYNELMDMFDMILG